MTLDVYPLLIAIACTKRRPVPVSILLNDGVCL